MTAEGNAALPPQSPGLVPAGLPIVDAAPALAPAMPITAREVPFALATFVEPHVPPARALEPAAATVWAPLDERRVTRLLVAAMLALAALNVVALYLRHGLGYDYALGMVPLFDFNMEANAPTWFSSALLLGVGTLAALIARRAATLRGYWVAVAAVAVFLSLDESVQLHELLTRLLRSGLAVGPGFSMTIVAIVSLLPVLLGAAVFHRFMRALPRPTAVGLLAAGAVYLGGAVGVDTIAAMVAFGGGAGLVDPALNTVEELLEMSGLILAIHVLLAHLQERAGHDRAAAIGG